MKLEVMQGHPNDDAIVTSGGEVWSYARLSDEVHRHDGSVRNPRELLVGALARFRAGRPVILADALPKGLPPEAALVFQTSGSRGTRKLVMLGADAVSANIDAILSYLPINKFPRTGVVLPFHYAYALVGQALATFRAGGTVVLLHDVANPDMQLEQMRKLGVQGVSSVPGSLAALADVGGVSLGYVASAGARLDPVVAHSVRAAFPNATLFNQYGLTEASPRVAALSHDEPEFWQGSVGRAVPGVSLKTINGELVVNGPGLMLGYHEDPEGTAVVLTPDGLRTGDLADIDSNGYVFLRGRLDDVVKVGGDRVSLDEVARALRTEVDALEVIALDDIRIGSRLVCAYVASDDREQALRERAKNSLSGYKRPRRFTRLEQLPMLPNGKVDSVRLRAIVSAE